MESAAGSAIRRLAQDDPLFPKSLLVLHDPPKALHALGDVSLLGRRLVAIVGSRTPTPYGIRVAYRAAPAAAQAGLVVVGSFPNRNRIIAGLAECLLVGEGKIEGGTANAVRWMAGLGKAVMAVPGRIDDEVARGPNKLISDGAGPYLGPESLLEHFGIQWEQVVEGERRAEAEQLDVLLATAPDLLRAEAAVFDVLAPEPLHVDVIAARAALDASRLLAALSSLEIKGLAVQLPGKHFALAS